MNSTSEERRRILKDLIKQLHAGAKPEEVKARFKDILRNVTPLEIAEIEQDLIREGIPREEIQRLCDVHLAVFREQLEGRRGEIPPENPINILMEEHRILLKNLENLTLHTENINRAEDPGFVSQDIEHMKHIVEDLVDAEKHYLREENALFPVLEKHGIEEPPKIMWMEHNELREKKKKLRRIIEDYRSMDFKDFKGEVNSLAKSINSLLTSHIFKENNILFPLAIRVIGREEWIDIRRDFDEIGYCCFTPRELTATRVIKEEAERPRAAAEGIIKFETGTLTYEEIEAILNTIPIDITFVDKDDTVRYFNKSKERIFLRTRSVLGRKVQQCHPQKSIHIVNRILDGFRRGERDVAEFWIQKGGRLIHIRYYAVRGRDGEYLGTLEVTQDITGIKRIEGEKRLLDWKD